MRRSSSAFTSSNLHSNAMRQQKKTKKEVNLFHFVVDVVKNDHRNWLCYFLLERITIDDLLRSICGRITMQKRFITSCQKQCATIFFNDVSYSLYCSFERRRIFHLTGCSLFLNPTTQNLHITFQSTVLCVFLVQYTTRHHH